MNKLRLAGIGLALLLLSSSCFADAIIRSRQSDLAAFRNLLPDELYEKLGFEPVSSFQTRLGLFISRDMAVLADGHALEGSLVELGPAVRPRRDEITGEPLPTTEEEEEIVVRAVFRFPFDQLPSTLTLTAPALTGLAPIGFVLYHEGIAVNDFRYLNTGSTVLLDWEDAWYSAFTSRAMRRQYFAPMSGFIYVEP